MNRRQFLGSSVAAAVALAMTQGRALAESTPVSGAIEAVTADGALLLPFHRGFLTDRFFMAKADLCYNRPRCRG